MNFKLLLCSVAVGVVAVSCIDDKYDLDNIDTTSRIAVNDLVIPVNLSEVYLSDVIKIEDTSDIKIVEINGTRCYAVTREGSFDSDPIYIKAPIANTPNIDSQYATLYSVGGKYPIPGMSNDFTFSCNDVDKSIVGITDVNMSGLDFTITLKTPELKTGTYNDVQMQLPKGMRGKGTNGSYDAKTGIWTINGLAIGAGGVASATFTAQGIDFTANDFTYKNPTFDFTSNFSVLGGELVAEGATTEFAVDFTLGKLEVTDISGTIQYEIDGMNISPISLGSLPKFLRGDETNISLVNPLICLQTTNPVSGYGLNYAAGLTLSALRDDKVSKSFTSDLFTVGHNSANGQYNTVLSPSKPDYVPEKFAGFSWFAFNGLGNLLEGAGLPDAIEVYVNNPQIPEQTVTNFKLGQYIDGVVGSYELFAPLALNPGSQIIYTTTEDGWNKDIEDLTINSLTLTADGTNQTPLDFSVTIHPLDVNGNRIGNVTLTSNIVKAGATDDKVEFVLSGEIKGLDGVEIIATTTSGNTQTVSPDQYLKFNNIRVKVNGYYVREL